ncbi:hypothetical protein C2E23DRAFT_743274 [Lenzites betulinus]|nr:hypothetical protein C2E23DRAFT_743274 [Lenzites betulinus]
MPKVAVSSTASASTSRSSGAPFQNAHVLRRNQACHQCRRRKLVSVIDAKRPCSTCIRSHSYAVSHAPPGADLPSHPECTFDESSEPSEPSLQDSPKNRFERLESRINELEALLQEKDPGEGSRSNSVNDFSAPPSLIAGLNDKILPGGGPFSLDSPTGIGLSVPDMDEFANVAAFADGLPQSHHPFGQSSFIDMMHQSLSSEHPPESDFGMAVLAAGWPKNLPGSPFLRHLVDAFFTFTPIASRMFHAPTFLASLSLPPSHPKFPLPAILHAMCALGSLYTAAVSPTPTPPLPVYCESNPLTYSFAEMQIKAARESIEDTLRTTANLFGSLQAQVIVALWYWYNARWSEAYISFSLSLRYAVPCGLNACPPFESISSSNMTRSSIIPPAINVVDDEMRRNTFWIAYIMERHFAAINNFAMMLDDEDISQMLPVRGDQFEQGVLVPPDERQWSHERNVIENHLDDQLDSFILHVKAAMLLSKVKVFNSRYRKRHHLGDPALRPDPAGLPGMPSATLIQTTPAFIEIDSLLSNFKQTLPTHFRDPMAHGTIDVHLFTALSTIYFGVIVLHEGHARIGRAACISACRILAAARGILNLLYEAYSTSHNLALLGVFPMVCWFAAGRVLVRFLKAAIDANSEEHISALRTEVTFICSVITGIGESVPHAHHYGKMLSDYTTQTCGKEYATVVAAGSMQVPPRHLNISPPPQCTHLPHQLDDGLSDITSSADLPPY